MWLKTEKNSRLPLRSHPYRYAYQCVLTVQNNVLQSGVWGDQIPGKLDIDSVRGSSCRETWTAAHSDSHAQ